ncbi:hypothetical protein D9758_015786 [Tetrapyrgos nigripes]|uniref:DUF6533 domain-containing protein n=1 Tax=Tetrapyrgos nigripes TaxID=182062 RepID=A0A8H5C3U5_9AGAR|nr:hypothetical protein D9758_015786 [Tetrapyrgos nigripes]
MLYALTSSPSASSLPESDFTLSAQAVSRSFVASLAFLLYDILLTLDEEIELIWNRRKWSLFKFLYFYVRYVPFMLQLSVVFIQIHPLSTLTFSPLLLVGTEITPQLHFTSNDCSIWQIYQGCLTIVVFAPVDYILVARIYALFHSAPLVQLFISVCYVASVIAMSVGLALAVPEVTFDGICHTTNVSRKVLINGGAEVTFQTILFILTLYKFISMLREEGWVVVKAVPLLRIIIKDGIWAFFVLFTLVAAQALVYVAGREGGILYGWVLCAFSFSGYRILLNLNHIPRSRSRPQRNHCQRRSYSSPGQSNSYTPIPRTGLLRQIPQWAEYISPVSFDDWNDHYHDHDHAYAGGDENAESTHPFFTSIYNTNGIFSEGAMTGTEMEFATTPTTSGMYMGTGTGTEEIELVEVVPVSSTDR